MVPIKVYFLSERQIRRFSLQQITHDLQEFRNLLSDRIAWFYHEQVAPKDISFQYADDENEWIEVSTQEEWEEALRVIPHTVKVKLSWSSPVSTNNAMASNEKNTSDAGVQGPQLAIDDDPVYELKALNETESCSLNSNGDNKELLEQEPLLSTETQKIQQEELSSWEPISKEEATESVINEQQNQEQEEEIKDEQENNQQDSFEEKQQEHEETQQENQETEETMDNNTSDNEVGQNTTAQTEEIDNSNEYIDDEELRRQEQKVQVVENLVQGVVSMNPSSKNLVQYARVAIDKARSAVTFEHLQRQLDIFEDLVTKHANQSVPEEPPFEFQVQLDQLKEMGFTDETVLRPLLEQHQGDIATILTYL